MSEEELQPVDSDAAYGVRLSYRPGFGDDLTSWTATIHRSGAIHQAVDRCDYSESPPRRGHESHRRRLDLDRARELFEALEWDLVEAAARASAKICVDDTSWLTLGRLGGTSRAEWSIKELGRGALPDLEPADRSALESFYALWNQLVESLPWPGPKTT